MMNSNACWPNYAAESKILIRFCGSSRIRCTSVSAFETFWEGIHYRYTSGAGRYRRGLSASTFCRGACSTRRPMGLPYPLEDASHTTSYCVLALGKLGGQEPNYQSDLRFVLLYDRDGLTRPRAGAGTTVRHFFEQLVQRVMKRSIELVPIPGSSNSMADLVPSARAVCWRCNSNTSWHIFRGRAGVALERQSLCQARPIGGEARFPKMFAAAGDPPL